MIISAIFSIYFHKRDISKARQKMYQKRLSNHMYVKSATFTCANYNVPLSLSSLLLEFAFLFFWEHLCVNFFRFGRQ